MKRPAALLVLLGGGSTLLTAGCQEPPRTAQMEMAVRGLADLHKWDAAMQARGQNSYDAVMTWGPEILPILVAHVVDETPTAIYDDLSGRVPAVGDVCFLMLLELTGLKWQEFRNDGVFVHSVLPNPVFSIRWEPNSRRRVQERLREILGP